MRLAKSGHNELGVYHLVRRLGVKCPGKGGIRGGASVIGLGGGWTILYAVITLRRKMRRNSKGVLESKFRGLLRSHSE